jgi:hypothetical protein
MVQKTFRGYYLRKYAKPTLLRELKAIKVLTAAAKGYKVRKIMGHTKDVISIKREMADMTYDLRRALMMKISQA